MHARPSAGPVRLLGPLVVGGLVLVVLDGVGVDGGRLLGLVGELLPVVLVLVVLDAVAGRRRRVRSAGPFARFWFVHAKGPRRMAGAVVVGRVVSIG
ncbi:hypothetical protein PV377_44515 [Streptomyces ipomoeae]|uniref:hypothetical protein n=1 Tax=Streptomyces ipomoeae TaxID=103232 RepID=UPI0029B36DCD|nr:hypothetical protein [Streptomyces ipomoeae]MDX2845905.1 hypothetical protein [Streptomyces ipomoeae]